MNKVFPMTDQAIRLVKLSMARKWADLLEEARTQSENTQTLSPQEAYLAGVRWGYWKGVLDLAEVEIEQEPDKNDKLPEPNPALHLD
jgi:hypothetical protein